jgi:hypothetical protein
MMPILLAMRDRRVHRSALGRKEEPMLNCVRLTKLASAVFAAAFILCSRADALMVGNSANVAAATATNFAQPEQVRGFSCNLRIPCPFPNTSYGRVHSHASGRFYYESCRCDFGSDRQCAPVTSCYAEGGRCRGSCAPQSGSYPYPALN